jgi:ribosome-interacting GTPase 1
MPANLTPQYREAEERYRSAKSPEDKLVAMREMLALLPKHKGTEKIHAGLKKTLASLEEEAAHPRKHGGGPDPGHVHKEGAGQWVLLGPPNAGKSALVRMMTHAHPEVAPYPFTTRVPLPGMMPFEDVQVQLVDAPPVAPSHTEPWMTNLVRNADAVLIVLDVTDDDLASDFQAVLALLERARVWPKARPLPPDAPPILQRRPVLIAANKCDLDSDGTFAALAREVVGADLPFFPISAEHGQGLEELRPMLYRELDCIRIYTKEPGKKAEAVRPFVLPRGATVEDVALRVHKDVAAQIKFARIWGSGAFEGQQVDRHHNLADKDVVELHV